MRLLSPIIPLISALCAASASLIPRQLLPPDCAISCLQNADLGSCSATDNVCLCNNQPFIDSTTACIENACSGDDLANAEAFAVAICESVGVTLTSSPTSTVSAAPSDTPTAVLTSDPPSDTPSDTPSDVPSDAPSDASSDPPSASATSGD